MAKMLLCLLFTAQSLCAMAQQNRFIYIQTENKQAFYVKLDKKVFSSAASGYVIIPQLTDGSYNLQVGFPKNEWPEQTINCVIDKKDAGYTLKNFGDKGWGLFNMQTLEVLMAGTGNAPKAVATETKKDEFSNLLSNVVNDSSIRQVPITKPQPVAPAPVAKETPLAAVAQKPAPASKITKVLYVNGKQGAEMIYTDNNGIKTDTIRILIPTDKEQAATATPPPVAAPPTIKEEKPVVKEEPPVKEDKPVIKEEKPAVKEEKPVIKEDKPAPKEQFINMELPNPAGKQPEVVVTPVTPPVKKVAMINSNCRSHANEDDFLKIRKKMVAEDNDDDMVAAARKIFKTKCFTTEQIKNLGVLFLKDEGRYKFFDAAYQYVSDTDNFNSLVAQLTDEYYINRFKAMVRQ